jgi:hypothetical protein
VKQNRKNRVKKDREPVITPKEESDNNQNIADVVNDWISESRENRRAERAFSDERISEWKTISSDKRP